MKIFWIIVGILALMWLGFLHFENNQIRLELDGMKNKHFDSQNVDQYDTQNIDQYNQRSPRKFDREDNHPLNPIPNTTDGVKQDTRNAGDRVEEEMNDTRQDVKQERKELESRIDHRVPVDREDEPTSMNHGETVEAFLNTTQVATEYDYMQAKVAYKSLN